MAGVGVALGVGVADVATGLGGTPLGGTPLGGTPLGDAGGGTAATSPDQGDQTSSEPRTATVSAAAATGSQRRDRTGAGRLSSGARTAGPPAGSGSAIAVGTDRSRSRSRSSTAAGRRVGSWSRAHSSRSIRPSLTPGIRSTGCSCSSSTEATVGLLSPVPYGARPLSRAYSVAASE